MFPKWFDLFMICSLSLVFLDLMLIIRYNVKELKRR